MYDVAMHQEVSCLLASVAGVPEEKMVEAHGTFATATCTICKNKLKGDDIKVWPLGSTGCAYKNTFKGQKVTKKTRT